MSAGEGEVFAREWSLLRSRSSRSLERAGALYRALDIDPAEPGGSVLGVVGSKGKGTAAVYASAAVASAGLSVATVLSPGLASSRDRVRVDGAPPSAAEWRRIEERIDAAMATLPDPTPATGYLSINGLYQVAGILLMRDRGCDVAVVEAGVGGVSDELSLLGLTGVVLTGVFAEHVEILGPTPAAIAEDKAGVIGPRTRLVVSIPQSPDVAEVIDRHCAAAGLRALYVDAEPAGLPAALSGHSRINAAAGVRAGLLLAGELRTLEEVAAVDAASDTAIETAAEPGALAAVLDSVRYPGRQSLHAGPGGDPVLVDAAITREGLASALAEVQRRCGRPPARVVVCLPADKDVAGFVAELGSLAGADRVFVTLESSHFEFPDPGDWPWRWTGEAGPADGAGPAGESGLAGELSGAGGPILAVGTALFVGRVLDALGEVPEALFDPAASLAARRASGEPRK